MNRGARWHASLRVIRQRVKILHFDVTTSREILKRIPKIKVSGDIHSGLPELWEAAYFGPQGAREGFPVAKRKEYERYHVIAISLLA
jgi:hypothetical protein